MIVYFINTEGQEQEYYRTTMVGEDARFVGPDEPIGEDAEAICLFVESIVNEAFLAALPRLRLIATRSRAFDHIDVAACRARGVTVCHTPEAGATTVAEHTFALLLALSRRLREFMLFTQQDHLFSYEDARAFDLRGKTLGIIGLGQIGQRVCALAHAFGMKIVAWDLIQKAREDDAACPFQWLPLPELLATSDVVSLHINHSAETHHLLNAQTLALCKRGALLINTARGRLIDTQALREALESGQIGGAGLDVLENESMLRQPASKVMTEQILEQLHSTDPAPRGGRLSDLRQIMAGEALLARLNVVFTPHVAFNSIETVEMIAQQTVRNLQSFAAGSPVNVVS